MARKDRVVVLIGEVLVPEFDRMKPSVGLVIEFSNFVSSVEEINKIMLCLVDLVLFALLSEIFFDRTLLWPFFGPESFGFQSSSKSTLWRSFCNDYRNKVKLLVQALTSSL